MGILVSAMEVLFLLLSTVFGLILIYTVYEEFRPLALFIHLDRKMVSFFIIGSLFGLGAMPVVVSSHGWIMADMAGALVPTILAVYFWIKNRLNVIVVTAGIALIAYFSYKITIIIPDLGIGAGFPDYLLPVFVSIVISAIYGSWKGKEYMLPMSFTIAALGTLIGADLVRIPKLVFDMDMGGSIGGARTVDLVLVSPLLAFSISFLILYLTMGFSRKRLLRNIPLYREKPFADDCWIARKYYHGYEALKRGSNRETISRSLEALRSKMRLVLRLQGHYGTFRDPGRIPRIIFAQPVLMGDYLVLEEYSKKKEPSQKEAYGSLVTTRLLMDVLDEKRRRVLASFPQRIGSFLLDQVLLISLTILIYFIWISRLELPLNDDPQTSYLLIYYVFPFSIWGFLQLPYFVIFEFRYGGTPGKFIMGIRVIEPGRRTPSLESTLSRNVARYFEMLAGGYLLSLIVMGFSKNRSRIGDMISGTVVVRVENHPPC